MEGRHVAAVSGRLLLLFCVQQAPRAERNAERLEAEKRVEPHMGGGAEEAPPRKELPLVPACSKKDCGNTMSRTSPMSAVLSALSVGVVVESEGEAFTSISHGLSCEPSHRSADERDGEWEVAW